MLKNIHIQHFAIIDELDIQFNEGFSVITGETGSGKSILLGAIGLLLGNRADTKTIQEGCSKCVIEAEFCLSGYNLQQFFEEEGFDYDESSCIIRRELTAAGKSRAFINDSPASLTQLRQLGAQLIDVHSQHQNMLLANEAYQLSTLDIIADNASFLESYQKLFGEMKDLQQQLDVAIERQLKDKSEEDYMQFQFQQLADFSPKEGEEETLEEERTALEHAEEIKGTFCQSQDILTDNAESVVSSLALVSKQMDNVVKYYPQAEGLSQRLSECLIEIKDISAELSSQNDKIDVDPQRLDDVLQRIDKLYDLLQKHGVKTAQELCTIQQELEERLGNISSASDEIDSLRKKVEKVHQQANEVAVKISERRIFAARKLEEECSQLLTSLGMPNGRVEVSFSKSNELRSSGKDEVDLLFTGNKNQQMLSIAQYASGGEIARVMLALKNITSQHRALPTIIFDEIDTGVSGRIAESMAHIMKHMAERGSQVITITHLPQIAAMGKHHYKVYKVDGEAVTRTQVQQLDAESRVVELAQMLSGEDVTQAAIENAKELLK